MTRPSALRSCAQALGALFLLVSVVSCTSGTPAKPTPNAPSLTQTRLGIEAVTTPYDINSPWGSGQGRILCSGEPFANKVVSLIWVFRETRGGSYKVINVMTDNEGAWINTGLPPGDYFVWPALGEPHQDIVDSESLVTLPVAEDRMTDFGDIELNQCP